MRGFLLGCLLLFCAALASAEDAAGALRLFAGGFAPEGESFEVALEFSDLKLAPPPAKPPDVPHAASTRMVVSEWIGFNGVDARLDLCCLKWPMGLNDAMLSAARLRLANPAALPLHTTLSVRIVPRGEIHALSFEKHAFLIGGRFVLVSDTPSRGAILAESPFAPRPLSPQDSAHVESARGGCRGEMLFDLTLAPGQTQTLGFIVPLRLPDGAEPTLDFYRALTIEELFTEAQKQSGAGERGKP